MSQWNHNICWQCWLERELKETGQVRVPFRIGGELSELDRICCFCAHRNIEGIFVREDPKEMPCKGNHAEEE